MQYMQSRPSQPAYMDSQQNAYASNGLGGGAGSFFPQQRISPLTFAGGLGLPMSMSAARARGAFGTGGLYNAATAAAVSLL